MRFIAGLPVTIPVVVRCCRASSNARRSWKNSTAPTISPSVRRTVALTPIAFSTPSRAMMWTRAAPTGSSLFRAARRAQWRWHTSVRKIS